MTMSPLSFRPRLEELNGRILPSANPVISVGDASVVEGNDGPTALLFRFRLSKRADGRTVRR
jgi:hypothetical protein